MTFEETGFQLMKADIPTMNDSVSNSSSQNLGYAINCYALEDEYPLHGIYYVIHFTFMVTACCLVIPITVLNFISISVFGGKHKTNTLQCTLLLNLSVCDLLIGCVGLPLHICNLLFLLLFKRHFCLLYAADVFAINVIAWVSFLTLFLVSIDRYVAVVEPRSYARGKHIASVYRLLLYLLWLLLVGANVGGLLIGFYEKINYLVFVSPLVILYGTFAHLRARCAVSNVQQQLGKLGPNTEENFVQSENKNKLCSTIREAKVAKLTGALLIVGCACHLPYFVLNMIPLLSNRQLSHLLHTLTELMRLWVVTRSLINPVLYYQKNVSLRLVVRRIFRLQRNPARRDSPSLSPYPANQRDLESTISNKDIVLNNII